MNKYLCSKNVFVSLKKKVAFFLLRNNTEKSPIRSMNPSPIKKNESYKVAYKNNKIEQVKDSKSQFPRRPRTIVRSIPY